MPVYKKASARGQLQPRHDEAEEDDNAVTRFQRRSPLPGAPIAARIAGAARPRDRSIDDEAMTVLLDRASLFPAAGRSRDARSTTPPRARAGVTDEPRASRPPQAQHAQQRSAAARETSAPAPTLTRPRTTMPAPSAPPPLPPSRPSAPAPAVTISRPPPPDAPHPSARARVSTDTLRTRRRSGTAWRLGAALAVLLVGGSVGAAITLGVAHGRATIAAEPAPAVPARAMDLPPAADPATRAPIMTAACAAGDPTMPAAATLDHAGAGSAASGATARRAHRSGAEGSAAHRAVAAPMAPPDAGVDVAAAGQDDFAAAADALSKAQLETTLP